MFGSKRRKATDAAAQVVGQVVRTATLNRRVPPDFWSDEYVLGVVYGLAGTVSRQAVGRMGTADEGQTIFDVLAQVSDNAADPRNVLRLIQTGDVTFLEAAQRASKVAVMIATQSIIEVSPDIEEATRRAKSLREVNATLGIRQSEIADVISALSEMWLTEPLRARTSPD